MELYNALAHNSHEVGVGSGSRRSLMTSPVLPYEMGAFWLSGIEDLQAHGRPSPKANGAFSLFPISQLTQNL